VVVGTSELVIVNYCGERQCNICCVFVWRAFCDCYSLLKWQTLKSGEFATGFVLTLRK